MAKEIDEEAVPFFWLADAVPFPVLVLVGADKLVTVVGTMVVVVVPESLVALTNFSPLAIEAVGEADDDVVEEMLTYVAVEVVVGEAKDETATTKNGARRESGLESMMMKLFMNLMGFQQVSKCG